MLKKQEAVL